MATSPLLTSGQPDAGAPALGLFDGAFDDETGRGGSLATATLLGDGQERIRVSTAPLEGQVFVRELRRTRGDKGGARDVVDRIPEAGTGGRAAKGEEIRTAFRLLGYARGRRRMIQRLWDGKMASRRMMGRGVFRRQR